MGLNYHADIRHHIRNETVKYHTLTHLPPSVVPTNNRECLTRHTMPPIAPIEDTSPTGQTNIRPDNFGAIPGSSDALPASGSLLGAEVRSATTAATSPASASGSVAANAAHPDPAPDDPLQAASAGGDRPFPPSTSLVHPDTAKRTSVKRPGTKLVRSSPSKQSRPRDKRMTPSANQRKPEGQATQAFWRAFFCRMPGRAACKTIKRVHYHSLRIKHRADWS